VICKGDDQHPPNFCVEGDIV